MFRFGFYLYIGNNDTFQIKNFAPNEEGISFVLPGKVLIRGFKGFSKASERRNVSKQLFF